MGRVLSDIAVERYRRDGFFFPWRALSARRANDLRRRFEAFDESEAAALHEDRHHDLYLFKPHLLFTWADEIVHDPAVLDAAEDIVGPNILAWSAGVFKKDPHSPSYVSWHQDATHYHLDDPSHVVRVWVALTPATMANGTMTFAPGTHRLGQLPHEDTVQRDGQLSRGETIELEIDPDAVVPVELQPGEASIHHLYTAHASGPNDSDRPRINLVITYIATKVRPLVGQDTAMLVRGDDECGHYELEPRPQSDFDPAAVVAHRRAMAIRNRNFFGHVDRRMALSGIMAKAPLS